MDVPRRSLAISPLFFVAALLIAVAAAPAHAAGGEPVEKVTALNRKAIDAYNKQDYDTAQALLKEALDVCNNTGLDKHPIKARTHVHLGVVSIVGFKQKDRGLKHFRKALEIQPDIKLTKSLATPELQDAFEEATVAGGGGDGGEPAGGAPAVTQEGEGGEAAPGGEAAAAGDDESAPPRAVRRRPKKPSSEEEGEEDDEESPYSIYFAIAGGTGFGIASGQGELNAAHELKTSGFAMAQAGHVTPELGYFINPRLMLSARLRLQFVSGLTEQPAVGNECGTDRLCTPGTTAFAAFVRATYFLGTGMFRPFLAGEVGGGNIRHAQVFPADTSCGPMGNVQCVDTLASGPFFFGPVAGFLFDFSNTVGLVVNLAADVGLSKFTINFDINGGLALHF